MKTNHWDLKSSFSTKSEKGLTSLLHIISEYTISAFSLSCANGVNDCLQKRHWSLLVLATLKIDYKILACPTFLTLTVNKCNFFPISIVSLLMVPTRRVKQGTNNQKCLAKESVGSCDSSEVSPREIQTRP